MHDKKSKFQARISSSEPISVAVVAANSVPFPITVKRVQVWRVILSSPVNVSPWTHFAGSLGKSGDIISSCSWMNVSLDASVPFRVNMLPCSSEIVSLGKFTHCDVTNAVSRVLLYSNRFVQRLQRHLVFTRLSRKYKMHEKVFPGHRRPMCNQRAVCSWKLLFARKTCRVS